MKVAFIYAGQGSQHSGMGKDLYETYPEFKQVFDAVPSIREICFNGSEQQLTETQNTQPCMVAFAAGVTEILKSNGIIPAMTAGLSIGEYSALNCSGVFDVKTAVEISTFRGNVMEQASRGVKTKMAAILNIDRDVLANICKQVAELGVVEIANYNCPIQLVIGGDEVAVDKACELALVAKAKKCIPLKVSGPFHTSFMKPAADKLKEKFEEVVFNKMSIPVVFNTTGSVIRENQTIAQLLEKQVKSSVYFEDCIRHMIENDIDTIVEIGPGKALSGFVKKIDGSIAIYNAEDVDSVKITIEALKGRI